MVPNSAWFLAKRDRLSAKKDPLTWCFVHRQRALYWSGRQDSNLRPLDPQCRPRKPPTSGNGEPARRAGSVACGSARYNTVQVATILPYSSHVRLPLRSVMRRRAIHQGTGTPLIDHRRNGQANNQTKPVPPRVSLLLRRVHRLIPSPGWQRCAACSQVNADPPWAPCREGHR